MTDIPTKPLRQRMIEDINARKLSAPTQSPFNAFACPSCHHASPRCR